MTFYRKRFSELDAAYAIEQMISVHVRAFFIRISFTSLYASSESKVQFGFVEDKLDSVEQEICLYRCEA